MTNGGRSLEKDQCPVGRAEVRLYGTEQTRTLEIVATAAPEQAPEVTDLIPEIAELTIPEIAEGTTR